MISHPEVIRWIIRCCLWAVMDRVRRRGGDVGRRTVKAMDRLCFYPFNVEYNERHDLLQIYTPDPNEDWPDLSAEGLG
ncbi:MAG: hypothetical protein SFV32_12660 [Opitutaceae bacterium]|nr:hypothetical protein [Opitutaceae bacterium]